MAKTKPIKCGIATIWDSSGEVKSDILELDKFKTEAMAARTNELEYRSNLSSKNAMDIKELQNKITIEANRILGVDDKFIGHRRIGFLNDEMPRWSTWNNSPIVENLPTYKDPPPPPPKKETPEPYTYEVKDHILEDCGGWDDLFENSIDDLHKKYKLLMSGYNSLSKKERESEDGLKRWKKLNELSDRIIELDNNFQDFRKGDENFLNRFKKYFNSESLHHALVFGSIVFGLKMIEMNWSLILGYINSIPIEGVYLSVMFFILTQTIIRAPKTYETGPK